MRCPKCGSLVASVTTAAECEACAELARQIEPFKTPVTWADLDTPTSGAFPRNREAEALRSALAAAEKRAEDAEERLADAVERIKELEERLGDEG